MDFEVNRQFNKIFQLRYDADNFTPPKELVFEDTDDCLDGCDHLRSARIQLETTKSRLNFLNLNKWHEHTKFINPAGKVKWFVQKTCDPELLTQAWLKFYQILDTFDLFSQCIERSDDKEHSAILSQEDEIFRTLHLCEAPGAFVTALNHYIRTNNDNLKWHWKASSLNPHYEGNDGTTMVSDDRFIVRTIDKWDFGPDKTGNIKDEDTRIALGHRERYHLVTADGSVDCQELPQLQEETVAQLLWCETAVALQSLWKGGSFVIKTFTWFSPTTCSLLYTLCAHFKRVTAIKPVCSKEGNSEVYVVCQDFQGLPLRNSIKRIWEACKKESPVLASMPNEFLQRVASGAQFFCDLQVEAIEKNIRLYKEMPKSVEQKIRSLQTKIAEEFVERFGPMNRIDATVAPRDNYRHLSPPSCPWSNHKIKMMRKSLTEKDSSNAQEILKMIIPTISKINLKTPAVVPVINVGTRIKYGKVFEIVINSKFLPPWLLKLYHFCRFLNVPIEKPEGAYFTAKGNYRPRLKTALDALERGKDFCISGFTLLTYVDVGILVLLTQQFDKCVLTEVTPLGCTFEFHGYKGFSDQLACALSVPNTREMPYVCPYTGKQDEVKMEVVQLLEVVPITSILYGDLHPLVEQANEQTVLRLAQATLALLPENRGDRLTV
ncbi:cap-specific mRNA (nucleoside-2'-O-)-methyltransferase 2 isoform X2 [Neocloeon triangulifer]|uniref:cap-specific mRNA (nucleoside-2'-O-)-methyltransferase 2 isoform X2 n=1 Tax=Neocloeon triangulifer TaxID=2078957 RepID=UPI00286F01D7|nr:cap-specific mRNA (nucleoside-2'-O-)-methyltransferase 2 isoform X2 [Neocloeon triangulifer]